jgi:hypothetical protein
MSSGWLRCAERTPIEGSHNWMAATHWRVVENGIVHCARACWCGKGFDQTSLPGVFQPVQKTVELEESGSTAGEALREVLGRDDRQELLPGL